MPPLWPPLAELAQWLPGLTESEIQDVILYLRRWPFYFRVAGEDIPLDGWNGWEEPDWKAGRARWKHDNIDYLLQVEWRAVEDAVTRLRARPEREALQALAPKPKRGGRRPRYPWADVTPKISQWLEDEGAPNEGDGRQAELEKFTAALFHPDECPVESVIRAKVRDIIKEFVAHRRRS